MAEASEPSQPSYELLEELYEFAPFGYLSITPDGRIGKVNETFLSLTGFSRDDLVSTPFTDLLSLGSQLFYETRFLPTLHLEGTVSEVALSFRRADGGSLPVLVNSTLVRDERGGHRVTRTAVFEATARQNYEHELLTARRAAEASEERVRILQDASLAFGAASTERELAEALVSTARAAFAASDVAVLLVDDTGALELAAGRHPLEEAFRASGRQELNRVATSSIVTMTDYAEFEPRFPGLGQALSDARVASLAVTPIHGDNGPVGVYVCFFGRRREFDEPMLEMQAAIARQAAIVLERTRLTSELQRLALYDQLTGLASRRLMHEGLGAAILAARRSGSPLTLVFADLDGFKAINDHLGHSAGDDVLIEVARRFRSTLRESDLIGRFGGDEFVAVCENADAAAAIELTERLLARISGALPEPATAYPISASIGVAVLQPGKIDDITADVLFEAADSAMYVSKDAGKNRVTLVQL